jgi:hypothetical protein
VAVLFDHDDPAADVEHGARFDGGTQYHDISRISDYDAALGQGITGLVGEVQCVGCQEVLLSGDDVEGTMELHTLDFHFVPVGVIAIPGIGLRDPPTNGGLVIHESSGSPW